MAWTATFARAIFSSIFSSAAEIDPTASRKSLSLSFAANVSLTCRAWIAPRAHAPTRLSGVIGANEQTRSRLLGVYLRSIDRS